MARKGYGVRFRYVLWLWHLATGEIPVYADIGRGIGAREGGDALVGQTVSGWTKRELAPDNLAATRGLAGYFGVSMDWLVDGSGSPPRPDLWAIWDRARSRPGLSEISELEAATGAAAGKRAK